jgi:hypothetical protein
VIRIASWKPPKTTENAARPFIADDDGIGIMMLNYDRIDSLEIASGWHLIRDGAAWCAIGPVFADLAISPVGWGDTQQQAYDYLEADLSWIDSETRVPPISEFKVWS